MRAAPRLLISLLLLIGLVLAVAALCSAVGASEGAPVAMPAATVADWQADPDLAVRRGLDQAKDTGTHVPVGGWSWSAIAGTVLVGLSIAIPALAQTLGSTHPIARVVTAGASMVWNLVAHREHRRDDRLATALLAALPVVARELDPAARARLCSILLRSLPADVLPVAHELLNAMAPPHQGIPS